METIPPGHHTLYPRKFKSYYVVWKLGLFQHFGDSFFSFKSYYVVWKPYEVTEAKDGKYRLNRTMQYGNFNRMLQLSKKKLV